MLLKPREGDGVPAIISAQPETAEPFRSSERLLSWESEVAQTYGIALLPGSTASATNTETGRPDAGTGDCDADDRDVS